MPSHDSADRVPLVDWAAVHAVGAWRLTLPRAPLRGRVGERLGSGTGASLEFLDHRPYVPGDDLRHVDWTAYARSDVLALRLYREEVAPRTDLVIDASRSMAVTPGKHQAYTALVALLASAAAATGTDVRVVIGSGRPAEPLHRAADVERFLACEAATGLLEDTRILARRGSMRVVVSDFLFPHDADLLVGRLARDATSLTLVQLTLREEAEPSAAGAHRLVDVEGHGALDVTIDAGAVRAYCERFSRLRVGLSTAARRTGARFVPLLAETPLRDMARALAAAGVLETR